MNEAAKLKDRLLTIVWSASMALISVSVIVNNVVNFTGLTLPDLAVRILGIVELLSLGVMAWSTVMKFRSKLPGNLKGEDHDSK